MPPTPIPAGFGIATVKIVTDVVLDESVCTFGYQAESADSPLAEAGAIGEAWRGNFTNAKLAQTHTFESLYILRNIGGALYSAIYNPAGAGTGVFETPAPAVAARITKTTDRAGKAFRGRMYLPAGYLDEGQIDVTGAIDAAAVTSLQTSADGLLDDLAALGKPMYLLHADGVTAPNPITSLLVRPFVGTQRRRQTV